MLRTVRTCGLVLVCIAATTRAWAQDERVRVSGTLSVAAGDGGPTAAIGVASGFQLAPHAGFELELLYIPDQDFDDRNSVIIADRFSDRSVNSSLTRLTDSGVRNLIFPAPQVSTTGRTVAFLSSFVGDLSVGRLRPYVQLGGGIANVERRISVTYPGPIPLLERLTPGESSQLIPITIAPVRYAVAENKLALTAGAGLDVRVWKRLSVAADVRYLRLFSAQTRGSDQAQDITRIGARASWWF